MKLTDATLLTCLDFHSGHVSDVTSGRTPNRTKNIDKIRTSNKRRKILGSGIVHKS